MMQSKAVKKRRALMVLAAVFAAVCLLVSCSGIPAYANVDPTWEEENWEEEETVIPEQTPEETPPEDIVPKTAARKAKMTGLMCVCSMGNGNTMEAHSLRLATDMRHSHSPVLAILTWSILRESAFPLTWVIPMRCSL